MVVSDASWEAYKYRGANSSAHRIYGSRWSFHFHCFPIYGNNWRIHLKLFPALERQTSSYSLSRPFTI